MEDALTDPPAAAHGQYIYVMGGLLGMSRWYLKNLKSCITGGSQFCKNNGQHK